MRGVVERRAGVRGLPILCASLLVHGLVVLALVAGLGPPGPLPDTPAVEVQLFSPAPAPALSLRPERSMVTESQGPAPVSRPLIAYGPRAGSPDEVPPGNGPLIALPANPEGAGSLVLGSALQPGLRRQLGCANAGFLKLSKAELDSCAQRLAEGAGRSPQLAVVSAEKQAIFDSDCPPKDEWCLYRTGRGPYPGLFSLFKK
ncbi:MAG: hypothetical protein QE280_00065 [Caulobacter sp.]|nr:hypothetical protein [Caulobacter sp.]